MNLVDQILSTRVDADAADAAFRMLQLTTVRPAAKLELAAAGVIPALVSWLYKGPSSETASCALPILQNLMRGCPQNRERVVAAGALPPLIAILNWELPPNPDPESIEMVQEMACETAEVLQELAASSPQNADAICDMGSLPRLIAMLEYVAKPCSSHIAGSEVVRGT